MTTEKKLIFITTDEDLVRQISFKKPKNTHFIDLDTGERVTSIISDKPSEKATCIICGDHAIGYNYDVLSCASCKAFFHRYADENPIKLKCLKSKNQCLIDYRTNRRCFRCRLNKCLSMGMRKDFLLRKNQRSQNILPITNTYEFDDIDRLLLNINENDINNILIESNNIENILTNEDLAIIHHVQTSFLTIFENISEGLPDSIDLSDRASAIISWAQFDGEVVLQTIRFFRQIKEFENLHNDDRFILIKYNLFPLMNIRKSFDYRPMATRTSIEIENEKKRKEQFLTICEVSDEMQRTGNSLTDSVIRYTEHDPVLLSLLLLIGLFSPTLSLNLDEPLLKDSLSVCRAQVLYTKVLWNYLLNKYGETKAYEKIIQLTAIIFQVQSVSAKQRKLVRDIITTSNTVDKITALMQTVLHIC